MVMARTLRVLVVDDQESMRSLLRSFLIKLNFETIGEAASGNAALVELNTRLYSLVISDFNMEDGSGLDLLNAMRAHAVLKKVPVIMVTGDSKKTTVMSVMSAGVDAYLVKPVSLEAVRSRIAKVLGPLN